MVNELLSGTYLIKIKSPGCMPCKMMEPVWSAVKTHHESEDHNHVQFREYDSSDPDVGVQDLIVKYDVTSAPTFLALRDGKLCDTKTGIINKATLEKMYNNLEYYSLDESEVV